MDRKNIFSRTSLIFMAVMLIFGYTYFDNAQALAQRSRSNSSRGNGGVPRGTEMKLRLNTDIDTSKSKGGDRFSAVVLSPSKYADATVNGHIASIKQSGKLKGQTVLKMVFDSIRLQDGNYPLQGDLVKVYGEKSAKNVDDEGNVKSGGRGSSTVKRSAGGAAVGAILGGVLGGGKGAAIGAAAGAGAGAGSNVARGADKIKIESGTEMLIRSR